MSLVKSAQRVLQILEYFDEIRRPASIIMIAEALDFPHSSTTALLRSLVAMGYLSFNSRTRLYQPTEQISLLGSWISPLFVQAGNVQRLVENLSEITGLNAALVACNQNDIQCIFSSRRHDTVHFPMRVGEERPIFRSSFGSLFLATRNDSEISFLVRSFNAYVPPNGRINPEEFLSSVERARRDEYVVGYESGLELIGRRLPGFCAARPLAIGLIGRYQQVDRTSLPLIIDDEICRWITPAENEYALLEVTSQSLESAPAPMQGLYLGAMSDAEFA